MTAYLPIANNHVTWKAEHSLAAHGFGKQGTIARLDICYDVERLWSECSRFVSKYGWGVHGQISLTHRANIDDPVDRVFDGIGFMTDHTRPFSILNEECLGTYIEEVLKMIPYQIGRLRIMRLYGGCCYSVHRDQTRRIHLPLVTNPQALMVFPDEPLVVHLPADGQVYLTNTRLSHTALNGSTEDRYHLVGALIE